MKSSKWFWMLFLMVSLNKEWLCAQTFPTPGYFHNILNKVGGPTQNPGVEGFENYVVAGKLRLSLNDAIRLVMLNNTDIRINHLAMEESQIAIGAAYSRFDPTATASFDVTRSSSRTEGADLVKSLDQTTQFGFSQLLTTGTSYDISLNASKSSDSDSYFREMNSGVELSFTQPLLRGRGMLVNRAPITIARRNCEISLANFTSQVNNILTQIVNQYWAVVQDRENLKLQQRALEMAETTANRDKRALELGALPPLDIYRSEAQVAQRRLDVIRAEYNLRQAEDGFRRQIGADLMPDISTMELELIEKSEPSDELVGVNVNEALQRALSKRPEFEALHMKLANADTSIQVANNAMKPDLDLQGKYSTSNTDVSFGKSLRLGNYPTYGVSLQLSLPIKNRVAQADLANSLIAKRRNLYLLRQLEQSVSLEVKNAVNQLEQAKLSMTAAKIARDLQQKTLESEQRKYDLGAQQIFFVLEAQTQLSQAEVNLLQAQINYQQALTEYDRATANLLERHGIKISEK